MKHKKPTYQELTEKVAGLEIELTKTQWLYKTENTSEVLPYNPDYGDLTELNTERTILDNIGKETLKILTSDLMDLLDTSVVIYEKNGDYAYAVFNSGWCQLLDASSRKLCNTVDNKAALKSGKWLCHEDCWNKSAKVAIDNQKRTDINCIGDIKLYAEPIIAQNEVIGAINIGYGNPPTDTKRLKELSEKYNIDFDTLKQKATAYNSRPDFIIDIAKKRLKSIASLIGEYISRKEAEQTLKESEEKLASIYRVAPTGIGVVVNRVLKEINPYICTMTGYSREELIDKNAQILYPSREEYESVGKEKYEQIRKTGTGIVETCWKKKDGTIIHVLMASTPIDINNHSRGVTFTALDISESKKAEQALRESEERFRYLFRDIPTVAVQGYQFNGTTTYWNKASEDLYGYTSEEAIGGNLFNLIIPTEIQANVRHEIRQMYESLKPAPSSEMSLVRKDGKRVTVLSSHAIVQRPGNEPELFCLDIDISQRKQAEKKLEESKQNLLTKNEELIKAKEKAEESEKIAKQQGKELLEIQKMSKVASFNWNFSDNSIQWSPEFFRIIEREPDTFTHNAENFFRFIYEPDKEKVNIAVQKSLRKEIAPYAEYRFVMPDKRIKEIVSNGEVIFDEEGNPIHMIGFTQDISEIRKTEKELIKSKEKAQESEQRLKLASQSAMLGVWDWNVKDNTMKWDKRMHELYGAKKETIVKTVDAWINGLHPDDKERAIAECNNALDGESTFDTTFRVKHPDGKVLFIKGDGMVIRDSAGAPVRMIGVNRDVTESKRSEIDLLKAKEKLEISEAKYKAAFHTSPDSVNINKLNGEYVEINEGFTRLTGFTEKDVIGKHSSKIDIWSIPADRKKLMSGLQKDDIVENLESIFKTKDGTLIPALMSAKIIYLKGEPHILSVTRAIVDRKKMEQELITSKEKAEEASHLKTEFLNNMSHEIRTPMNGIIGFSQLLDDPDISEEKRKYYSKIVQNSSYQLLRIIDDILEISTLETKQEKLNEESLCLNDLLMELFSIFNLKSKERDIPLYLKKALHDEESYIFSDILKLNKIISNLIENAIKFTNEGFIEFGYYLENSNLILYVKDTGIGISPKNHEIVFERFSQEDKEISKKQGGLGLGLSICKENAQLLGGDITLESDKGKGSTFFITVPYKPVLANPGNTSKKINDIKKANDKYTIVIAEDEEVNYLYLEVLFEDEIDGSYNLIHAKNGKEAVEICSSNINIDLVLMDIKMPVMNGHEAAEKIKEKFPDLPIIAQTAYSTESDKQLALNHGCTDFISKPIDRNKLFEMIHTHLTI